jgi:DNA-binding Lrp family transcriptional regulator
MKKKTIDAMDIEILNILSEHAELTNKELSNKIGLSEGPTLVRVQRLWGRGIIKSYGAIINYQYFGYIKFFLIRLEVADFDAPQLKERFLSSRYIVILIEIEASVDFILRVYVAVCQAKNFKSAKEEVTTITKGVKGIRSVTVNLITFASQKALHFDNTDVIK